MKGITELKSFSFAHLPYLECLSSPEIESLPSNQMPSKA